MTVGGERHSRGAFELVDGALADALMNALAVWEVTPRPSSEEVAAYATVAGMPEVPVWRAHLPGDMVTAEMQLSSAKEKLTAAVKTLDVLPERLSKVIQDNPALVIGAGSIGEALAKPEAELLAILSEIQRLGLPVVSFGVCGMLPGGWQKASQQIVAILDRVVRFVACYAFVETRVQEQLLGRTAVSWMGDVNTIWRGGLTREEGLLHQRTLALALESRDTLVRTVMMATQCALKVSTFLSTPGGSILALPVAWQFIRQVLAESGEYMNERKGEHNG